MIEMIVAGVVGLVAMTVVGVFAAAVAMLLWLIFLPFRIVGWLLKGLGLLLALPFLLLFGFLGALVFGVGAVVFLIPFAPFLLLAFLLWRWMRGRPRATVSA